MDDGDFRSEVSLILLRRAGSYDPSRAEVTSWARCIAESAAHEVRKKWARRNAILEESRGFPLEADEIGPDDTFWAGESSGVEELAIERVEQTERVILFNFIARRVPKVWYLIHQEEIDPERHFGMTPNGWAKRLVTVRQRVREVCADLDGGDVRAIRARLEREDAEKTDAERVAADAIAAFEAVRLHECLSRAV